MPPPRAASPAGGLQLDQYNNYSRMYRYSSFVLSLLLAFRLNRTYDRRACLESRLVLPRRARASRLFCQPTAALDPSCSHQPANPILTLEPPIPHRPCLARRWWNARCAFGGIGGGVVNVLRQVVTWNDDPVLHRWARLFGGGW